MGQGGAINWLELTVPDADRVRFFYETVAGWQSDPVEMGGYSDYVMSPRGGGPSAGICHKRGVNAGLPSVWLVYIAVANLEESLRQCKELGGSIVTEPRIMGDGKFAVIQDPAGAICALWEKGAR